MANAKKEEMLIGTNVRAMEEDGFLILKIKLGEDHGASTSGKTHIVGKTPGAIKFPTESGEVLIGVNINFKPKQ